MKLRSLKYFMWVCFLFICGLLQLFAYVYMNIYTVSIMLGFVIVFIIYSLILLKHIWSKY